MLTSRLLQMPDPDDPSATSQHRDRVFDAFGNVFTNIDRAFAQALPKALTTFRLWEGYVDLSVHAPIVRYLVKQELSNLSTVAKDDDEVEFRMQRVSNCGLSVGTALGEVKVLKAAPAGLPKIASDARHQFVEKNQMSLRFDRESIEPRLVSLSLFATWTMDSDYKYVGLRVACPRSAKEDGSIECYWVSDWKSNKVIPALSKHDASEEDLNITKRENKEATGSEG